MTPFGYYTAHCAANTVANCSQPSDWQYEKHAFCESWFNAQEKMEEFGLESIIVGLANQRSEGVDILQSNALTVNAFGGTLMAANRDGAAVDLARGRDMGVGDYASVRGVLGLEPWDHDWTKFDEISNPSRSKLESLYKNRPLDLYVGGLLESRRGKVGPTFAAILREQFLRIRDADRFWFENQGNGIFTPEEIGQIRNTTFIDVISAVTNLETF